MSRSLSSGPGHGLRATEAERDAGAGDPRALRRDAFDASAPFARRVVQLPVLGLGISTEYDARASGGLSLASLRARRPDLVRFLEVGADLARGVDDDARAWARAALPTTLHFLDVNLEEPEDVDEAWVDGMRTLARELGAAWLCGDAGIWHVGPRDRGHGTLLPPILEAEPAGEMADAIASLRERCGMEVLPENPPAHVYLGRMHLLDYFARVVERSDAGMLLDVAHLAIFQRARGHEATTGLDGFPLERVVEAHVAGATLFDHGGRRFVDDDHGPSPLADSWQILDVLVRSAPNLRAIVFECERNSIEAVIPGFERIAAKLAGTRLAMEPRGGAARAGGAHGSAGSALEDAPR